MSIFNELNQGIDKAVSVLLRRGAVVYPTDTGYGIGVDTESTKALKNLLMIKSRNCRPKNKTYYHKPTSIMVSDLDMMRRYAFIPEKAKILLHYCNQIPTKPLTLVLQAKNTESNHVKMLTAGIGFIGVRVANTAIAMKLIEGFGRAITTTSANPAGMPMARTIEECKKMFDDRHLKPYYYLDGGTLSGGIGSTLVKIFEDNFKVLREGNLSEDEVKKVIG